MFQTKVVEKIKTRILCSVTYTGLLTPVDVRWISRTSSVEELPMFLSAQGHVIQGEFEVI
jgi:hypothetical protein